MLHRSVPCRRKSASSQITCWLGSNKNGTPLCQHSLASSDIATGSFGATTTRSGLPLTASASRYPRECAIAPVKNEPIWLLSLSVLTKKDAVNTSGMMRTAEVSTPFTSSQAR